MTKGGKEKADIKDSQKNENEKKSAKETERSYKS